jgi:phospholipid/cholesterol/gamma-HCH transport system permease protein
MDTTAERCDIQFYHPSLDVLTIGLHGSWRFSANLPSFQEVTKAIESKPSIKTIAFDTKQLTGWDSGLITFLLRVNNYCAERQIAQDKNGLPPGIQRIIELATATPPKKTHRDAKSLSILGRIGVGALDLKKFIFDLLEYVGLVFLAFLKFLVGKARYQKSDLLEYLHECGPEALPIVTLISLLIGLILAFVGAIQLQMFGAQIYIANLVGLGMIREMGAIMAGIIMTGRTGSSFAARLGTMQVNEEIDAFRTMGISPIEFLVLPRVLAFAVMMPLICLYANFVGIIGGAIVSAGMFDISFIAYFKQTQLSVTLTDMFIGLFKSWVFGVLIGMASCFFGINSGRSSEAVGTATTGAVVSGIVLIVVSDSVLTLICSLLGI